MSNAPGTRRSPRHPAYHLVSFSRTRFGELVEPLVHLARTLDVSVGGAGLETDSPLQAGDRLTLQIAVANQIVDLTATVVHVRPVHDDLYATGIEFDPLTDEGRAALLGSD
jgi:hypothetical protein